MEASSLLRFRNIVCEFQPKTHTAHQPINQLTQTYNTHIHTQRQTHTERHARKHTHFTDTDTDTEITPTQTHTDTNTRHRDSTHTQTHTPHTGLRSSTPARNIVQPVPPRPRPSPSLGRPREPAPGSPVTAGGIRGSPLQPVDAELHGVEHPENAHRLEHLHPQAFCRLSPPLQRRQHALQEVWVAEVRGHDGAGGSHDLTGWDGTGRYVCHNSSSEGGGTVKILHGQVMIVLRCDRRRRRVATVRALGIGVKKVERKVEGGEVLHLLLCLSRTYDHWPRLHPLPDRWSTVRSVPMLRERDIPGSTSL